MTLSDIETTIQLLGDLFLERHGVPVPFLFGRTKYAQHSSRNLTAVFWLPVRSSVVTATELKEEAVKLPEKPKHYRVERFELILWDNTFAGVEALHRAVIDTLAACPAEVEFGDYEYQSEADGTASPPLHGCQIVQEVSIVTTVPTASGGTTLWTVLRTEHEDELYRDDGTWETHHTIPES